MKFINEWKEYKKPKSNYFTKKVNISKIELEDICDILNINDDPKFISSGKYGNAYKIGNKVLKITTDLMEAKSIYSIVNSKNNNNSIVKYYSINRYKLRGKFVYIIIMDYVETITNYLNKYKYKKEYIELISDCIDIILSNNIRSKEDINNELNDYGWIKYNNFFIDKIWNLFKNIKNIKDLDIHIDNIGIKNGEFILFDYREYCQLNKFDSPEIIKKESL